jgi:hypothetical protein
VGAQDCGLGLAYRIVWMVSNIGVERLKDGAWRTGWCDVLSSRQLCGIGRGQDGCMTDKQYAHRNRPQRIYTQMSQHRLPGYELRFS